MPRRKRRANALIDVSSVVSEAELQSSFVQAVRDLGWEPFHVPDSRRVTSKGFPDLTLRHDSLPPYIAVFELKTANGKVREGQPLWIEAFRKAGVLAMVLRLPEDWDMAIEALTGGRWT